MRTGNQLQILPFIRIHRFHPISALNAPPKSLLTDFFFQDTAARQIVLDEHAALLSISKALRENILSNHILLFQDSVIPIRRLNLFQERVRGSIQSWIGSICFLEGLQTNSPRKYTIKTAAARAAVATPLPKLPKLNLFLEMVQIFLLSPFHCLYPNPSHLRTPSGKREPVKLNHHQSRK